MFGEEFGLDYYKQRHEERLQSAERARLVRCLEANHRSDWREQQPATLSMRALAAAGGQLVRLGNRMQRAALSAH